MKITTKRIITTITTITKKNTTCIIEHRGDAWRWSYIDADSRSMYAYEGNSLYKYFAPSEEWEELEEILPLCFFPYSESIKASSIIEAIAEYMEMI